MMKYYQLGLQGRSSSNITAVSFLLIAQSLHFKEADKAPRWRCALRPTFKSKRKGKKERKTLLAALCCRLLWEQRGHRRGHVTMWSRSAGSQVGRPSLLCWRLSRATKTGPTVARKKGCKQEVCLPPSQRVSWWIFFKKLSQ